MNQNKYLAETDIEIAAIDWLLVQPPYRYLHGSDIKRDYKKLSSN
jgi:type I restriction enzyme, R subunit